MRPSRSVFLGLSRVNKPWNSTTTFVKDNSSIVIDGVMPVPGAQTAIFHFAFDNTMPHRYVAMVLKAPKKADKAESECSLFKAVEKEGPSLLQSDSSQ
jgi:hypothetical protein